MIHDSTNSVQSLIIQIPNIEMDRDHLKIHMKKYVLER